MAFQFDPNAFVTGAAGAADIYNKLTFEPRKQEAELETERLRQEALKASTATSQFELGEKQRAVNDLLANRGLQANQLEALYAQQDLNAQQKASQAIPQAEVPLVPAQNAQIAGAPQPVAQKNAQFVQDFNKQVLTNINTARTSNNSAEVVKAGQTAARMPGVYGASQTPDGGASTLAQSKQLMSDFATILSDPSKQTPDSIKDLSERAKEVYVKFNAVEEDPKNFSVDVSNGKVNIYKNGDLIKSESPIQFAKEVKFGSDALEGYIRAIKTAEALHGAEGVKSYIEQGELSLNIDKLADIVTSPEVKQGLKIVQVTNPDVIKAALPKLIEKEMEYRKKTEDNVLNGLADPIIASIKSKFKGPPDKMLSDIYRNDSVFTAALKNPENQKYIDEAKSRGQDPVSFLKARVFGDESLLKTMSTLTTATATRKESEAKVTESGAKATAASAEYKKLQLLQGQEKIDNAVEKARRDEITKAYSEARKNAIPGAFPDYTYPEKLRKGYETQFGKDFYTGQPIVPTSTKGFDSPFSTTTTSEPTATKETAAMPQARPSTKTKVEQQQPPKTEYKPDARDVAYKNMQDAKEVASRTGNPKDTARYRELKQVYDSVNKQMGEQEYQKRSQEKTNIEIKKAQEKLNLARQQNAPISYKDERGTVKSYLPKDMEVYKDGSLKPRSGATPLEWGFNKK